MKRSACVEAAHLGRAHVHLHERYADGLGGHAIPRALQEGCARHRWKAPTRQRVAALDCAVEQDELLWGESRVIFGAAPGLERLVLEADDCGDQLDSLRRVPADGSLAPAK